MIRVERGQKESDPIIDADVDFCLEELLLTLIFAWKNCCLEGFLPGRIVAWKNCCVSRVVSDGGVYDVCDSPSHLGLSLLR